MHREIQIPPVAKLEYFGVRCRIRPPTTGFADLDDGIGSGIGKQGPELGDRIAACAREDARRGKLRALAGQRQGQSRGVCLRGLHGLRIEMHASLVYGTGIVGVDEPHVEIQIVIRRRVHALKQRLHPGIETGILQRCVQGARQRVGALRERAARQHHKEQCVIATTWPAQDLRLPRHDRIFRSDKR